MRIPRLIRELDKSCRGEKGTVALGSGLLHFFQVGFYLDAQEFPMWKNFCPQVGASPSFREGKAKAK